MLELSYGMEVGYRLRSSLWLSGGYKFAGFEDSDSGAADYSREGVFLKFRFKFDEQSIQDLLEDDQQKP